MRHFLLLGTVAALACGMFVATGQTQLIALPGIFYGLHAHLLRAVTRAVAMATVTVAADEYHCSATGAEIVSS